MALTFDTTLTRNAAAKSVTAVADAIAQFKCLSVDDQLAVLWFAYTEIGNTITPAAPGAARLQIAEGLLNQIRNFSKEEQLQAMRDLAASVSTPVTRAYGILTANTKLAVWYQLAEWMRAGLVIGMPAGYELSTEGRAVLTAIQELDMGQQITVLRGTVVSMGVDPLV